MSDDEVLGEREQGLERNRTIERPAHRCMASICHQRVSWHRFITGARVSGPVEFEYRVDSRDVAFVCSLAP